MKNKLTAGLLAIFLGAYGAQHFYLGNKDKGIKYLLISLLTCGVGAVIISVISLIEGIKILSMSDDEFNNTFNGGATPVTSDSTSVTTNYEKIKQYKALYDMGAISEEEFNNMKKELLK